MPSVTRQLTDFPIEHIHHGVPSNSGYGTSPLKRYDMTITAKQETVRIRPPNLRTAKFEIKGTTPLLQAAFSEKATQAIRAKPVSYTHLTLPTICSV